MQAQDFRFFDNREKYLLFVTTCNEKQMIADRVSMYSQHLQPSQPGLKVFDAGMGDATVLTRVMRFLHDRFPTVPLLVVAKEISHEDVRIGLEKMADRFHEHPLSVLVLTNMNYTEAPRLMPRSRSARERLNWQEVALKGDSAYEFDQQIRDLVPHIQKWWQTKPSPRTGNPVYVTPSVMVIYREDHEWPLSNVIPVQGDTDREFDLVIAAQPFRAQTPASIKVKNVLAPLSRSLAPGGLMSVIQSTGKDPGMEIIRGIWPGERPFASPRQSLLQELRTQLGAEYPDLRYLDNTDSLAEFRYYLQLPHVESESAIGTSTLLAAWNAATYVSQVDDDRLREAMSHGDYLEVTSRVLNKYKGLWFVDESFLVTRSAKTGQISVTEG